MCGSCWSLISDVRLPITSSVRLSFLLLLSLQLGTVCLLGLVGLFLFFGISLLFILSKWVELVRQQQKSTVTARLGILPVLLYLFHDSLLGLFVR